MPVHSITLEFAEVAPPKSDAGTPLILKIKALCAEGCDLTGHPVHLTQQDGAIGASAALAAGVAELTLITPAEIGEHRWALVYPPHEADGTVHARAELPIAIEIKAHDTSLAVWDVPSPLQMRHGFKVMVGATCTAGCSLAGKEIEIRDEAGRLAGIGTLGESVWPGTKALYWAQSELIAPEQEGRATWAVRFAAKELQLPHGGTSFHFGSQIVRPPEHTVTVRVVEKETGAPLPDAQVRLGVFFAVSDTDGIARVETPAGAYELDVLKTGYDIQPSRLDVAQDQTVQVEMTAVPKEDPDAYWYKYPDQA